MAVCIRFEPAGLRARVPTGTSLLEAVRGAGLPLASACAGASLCGRCAVRILHGGDAVAPEDEAERLAKGRNRIDSELRLACRVEATEDLSITTSYW